MPKRMIIFMLVCSSLNLLSWFMYIYKLSIPKDQPSLEVLKFSSSARLVKSLRPQLPSSKTIRRMKDSEVEELFYTYVENMDVLCINKVRLGTYGYGGWDVCDYMKYPPRPPCLVYSFGVGFDFSFDEAASSRYGCEVHAFDPSMGVPDHKRSDRVFFHNMGLSNKDFVNSRGWTMKTLTSIKAQLKHTKISILKMDIDRDEYDVLPNIMASGELNDVDQLLFEIHLNLRNRTTIVDSMARGLEMVRDLRNLGFHIFHTHPNEQCIYKSRITRRSRTGCNEVCMLNLN